MNRRRVMSICMGDGGGDLIYVRFRSHKFILDEYLINAIKPTEHSRTSTRLTGANHFFSSF